MPMTQALRAITANAGECDRRASAAARSAKALESPRRELPVARRGLSGRPACEPHHAQCRKRESGGGNQADHERERGAAEAPVEGCAIGQHRQSGDERVRREGRLGIPAGRRGPRSRWRATRSRERTRRSANAASADGEEGARERRLPSNAAPVDRDPVPHHHAK
jgi:hypothetical protein